MTINANEAYYKKMRQNEKNKLLQRQTGDGDRPPSIDERKKQKFKKNFDPRQESLASDESAGSIDLPKNLSVEVKRKNSPGKSKVATAEK